MFMMRLSLTYANFLVHNFRDEEGTEHLRKRNLKLPFMFTTGEAVLYEVTNPFPPIMDPLPIRTKNGAGGKDSATKSTLSKDSLNPNSLLNAMMQQDESIYLYPASSSTPFERNFFNDSQNECSNWQNNVAPMGSDNILKHEQIGQSQEMNPTLSGDHAGLFPDNRNSDLYSIMKHLGIDFEDIKHMQQNEEFFRTDFSGEEDFRDIDLTDEILTYVEDSLNKSALGCSGYHQQQSMALNPSCMVQEHLQLEQQEQLQQHQKHRAVEQQQQLCQKMQHMQVNGMFANWNSNQSVPFNCPQQDLQQYNVFSDVPVPGTSQELPYKSEIDTMPYAQNFIPCGQSVLPPHSKGTQLDFPIGDFEPAPYPTTSSNLEDFVTCLQVPQSQRHGLNPQSAIVTPQTCYAGAVSMYQCQPEAQHSHVAQMQYNPTMPGPQAFLNKVRVLLN